jgi:hypothetical protein
LDSQIEWSLKWKYFKAASLRWHYPFQVAGIISAVTGTPCNNYKVKINLLDNLFNYNSFLKLLEYKIYNRQQYVSFKYLHRVSLKKKIISVMLIFFSGKKFFLKAIL